jgi:hypothetical protein
MELRTRSALLVAASVVLTAYGTASARADAVPAGADDRLRVTLQGTLALPDEVADADGTKVRITGLSGVAWLGDDRYVAVMDNSDLFIHFALELSQAGKPLAVRDLQVSRVAAIHDFEDVVPCPKPLQDRIVERRLRRQEDDPGECLLLVEENTPAIRAVPRKGGDLLGVVPLPENMKTRRANRGPESLAVDPDDGSLWTANEEALAADGPASTVGAGTTVRLTRVPLPPESGQPQRPTLQYAYAVDPPHKFVRVFAGEPLAGVSALVALGGGRLLVLERAAGPGLPPFVNRIFLIDTIKGIEVSGVERDLAARKDSLLAKRLLWQDSLGCNVEGLCLGPPLADGNRALIGIADNGGIGTPNQLVGLSLVLPAAKQDVSVIVTVAALVGMALLLGRLTGRLTSP